MATIAFVNVPAWGHVNPTLDIMTYLHRNGHTVLHYNSEEFRTVTEKTGATLCPLEHYVDELPTIPLTFDLLTIGNIILNCTKQVSKDMSEDMLNNNVTHIVSDIISPWGQLIGKRCGLPVLESNPTLPIRASDILFSMMLHEARGLINPLRIGEILSVIQSLHTLKKIPGYRKNQIPLERIIFSAEAFDRTPHIKRDTDHYVGPLFSSRAQECHTTYFGNSTKRKIFISLGTIYNDRLSFFQDCISAFNNNDSYEVLISLGNKITPSALGNVSKNIQIIPRVDQLSALRQCDVFISHGGFNSTSEALSFGKPILVVPQIGEQHINGKRIEAFNAGILCMPSKLSPNQILRGVSTLFDKPYSENAQKISAMFSQADNLEHVIEDWLKRTAVS